MKIVFCLALLGVIGCDGYSPHHSTYEAPGPSYHEDPTPPCTVAMPTAAVVHTADAGARAEDRTCPRPGYFGVPMSCCPNGTCNVSGSAGDAISMGYEAELGANATVHYIVPSVDFDHRAPFRSVVVEGRYTHVRITRDTSRRYRNQLAFNVRPVGGAQYTHIWSYAYTAPCSELLANHLRIRPARMVDDPWICVDLTPNIQVRRLTDEETYRSMVGIPLHVAVEPHH